MTHSQHPFLLRVEWDLMDSVRSHWLYAAGRFLLQLHGLILEIFCEKLSIGGNFVNFEGWVCLLASIDCGSGLHIAISD